MACGTMRWSSPTKRYGFIQPQGGGEDVLVHISAIERGGLRTLNGGGPREVFLSESRGQVSNSRVSDDLRWRHRPATLVAEDKAEFGTDRVRSHLPYRVRDRGLSLWVVKIWQLYLSGCCFSS